MKLSADVIEMVHHAAQAERLYAGGGRERMLRALPAWAAVALRPPLSNPLRLDLLALNEIAPAAFSAWLAAAERRAKAPWSQATFRHALSLLPPVDAGGREAEMLADVLLALLAASA